MNWVVDNDCRQISIKQFIFFYFSRLVQPIRVVPVLVPHHQAAVHRVLTAIRRVPIPIHPVRKEIIAGVVQHRIARQMNRNHLNQPPKQGKKKMQLSLVQVPSKKMRKPHQTPIVNQKQVQIKQRTNNHNNKRKVIHVKHPFIQVTMILRQQKPNKPKRNAYKMKLRKRHWCLKRSNRKMQIQRINRRLVAKRHHL